MSENKLPLDRGWAWMIVFGYFNSIFYMVGIAKSFGILLGEFVDYFDVPVALGAMVMGVAGAVYTIAAPICVALGQQYGQRVVVMIGGVVGAVGIALSSFLFSIEYVIIMFGALYGIGNSCIFGNGLVIIGNYFTKRRGLANGLGLSGASIGQFAMAPLLTFLIEKFALKGALLILGAMYLNVAVCGALYRPISFYMYSSKSTKQDEEIELVSDKEIDKNGKLDTLNGSIEVEIKCDDGSVVRYSGEFAKEELLGKNSEEEDIGQIDTLQPATVAADENDSTSSKTVKKTSSCRQFLSHLIDFSVLRNKIVIFYTVVSFLLFLGHFNFILFMPPSVTLRGISKYEKAWLVSITGVCDLFGRILIGFFGDMGKVSRYKLMAGSCLICSVAILLFNILAHSYWLMAFFIGIYGFFGGCYVSINNPVLIDLVGLKVMPKALGVVLFIQGLGAAFGQPLLGAVRDKLGSYEVVNYINCFSMAAGAILLMLYPLVRGKTGSKEGEPASTGT